MITATINKEFIDSEGESILYVYSSSASTVDEAIENVCIYASMVEYGISAEKWSPSDTPFVREELYQFIHVETLRNLEHMFPDIIKVSYGNAVAYVQSYIGAMFDVKAILDRPDTTYTYMTLKLALTMCTVYFILASSPQFAETTEYHLTQVKNLIRGLKTGQRNFGKDAIVQEPNVRVSVVSLSKTGSKP